MMGWDARSRNLGPIFPRAKKKVKEENLSKEKKDKKIEDKEEHIVSYVDTLLDLKLHEEKRKLDEGEMVSLCSEFLNTSIDTTSTVLHWIMANLVKYPHVQEKLFEKIKGVVGDGKEEGIVNFFIAEMGWDPKVWEDLMAFRLNRFLNSDGGEEVFNITGSKEIKMIPFGARRRMCLAYGLAMLHLEYFVASLILSFEWKVVDGDDIDLLEKQEFTMTVFSCWFDGCWGLVIVVLGVLGFEVPDSSVTKETQLRYNIYGFAWVIQFWAMEAILALQKIVAPFGPKDNVYPRMCRWDCNQKSKDFYKAIKKLESSDHLWALESLEPTADEAFLEYFMDVHVPLSEGHDLKKKRTYGGTKRMRIVAALVDELSGPELMDEGDDRGQGSEQPFDHAPAAPEPPLVLLKCIIEMTCRLRKRRQVLKYRSVQLNRRQLMSRRSSSTDRSGYTTDSKRADDKDIKVVTLTQSRIVNDEVVTTRQLRRMVRKHEKEMLELKASIQSLSGPSHGVGLEHDDANDGQHHEPGVDIDDDVFGANGNHVTHVDDVINEAVVVDVTFQSDDVEGEHVPLLESIIDASAGGDGEPDSVVAERKHLPQVDAFVEAVARAIVLYRGSTPDAVEVRSSSPESSAVHHGAVKISDPTKRAQLKMASKYMASPFVDPLVTRRDVRDKILDDYEAFKKDESTRVEVEAVHYHACVVDTIFFDTIRMLHTKFPTEDARAIMQIPDELRGYVEGERPTYSKKWEDVDFILAPCNVGGHWVVAKIDLVRWAIKVVDSVRTSDAKDNGVRAGQMTPLTTMMPFICHQASYFNNIRQKRRDLMPMPLDIHLPKAKVHRQNDSVSCGMFMIRYMDHILQSENIRVK
ncbi:Uncharacterized protein TCM_025607 [Theobroma cacao]|uniref:Ubiquitin-like protease family profile domain-containing protein n=1 Tax=Theobroma cacao TaxID=3641 RepID=A0A061EYU7_THECC|nr:Uncharacterized protein TCM_025607 [Theobroma cacao]